MPCRYKQAFQQPGAPTAAINYYRALIDCATWWVTISLNPLPCYLPVSRPQYMSAGKARTSENRPLCVQCL